MFKRKSNNFPIHQPVLLKEVIQFLEPRQSENFIDCNLGLAGHSQEILKHNEPKGKVLGIELDAKSIAQLKSEIENKDFKKRLIIAQGNFADLAQIIKKEKFTPVHGILFDLGLSSWQLEQSRRGFSFKNDEPLNMNYSGQGTTAEEIVNQCSEKELETIISEFGEERFAWKIAKKIVQARKAKRISRTAHLVEIIKYSLPARYRRGHVHFATRTFQALRIAVNNELDNFEKALPQALAALESKGRLVIISFHSLEDRIAKIFLREHRNELQILTKKPIMASEEEIKINPRSRSAKLRAAIKK